MIEDKDIAKLHDVLHDIWACAKKMEAASEELLHADETLKTVCRETRRIVLEGRDLQATAQQIMTHANLCIADLGFLLEARRNGRDNI